MYLVACVCPDQSFLALCHQHRVAVLSMLLKVNSNSNHCLPPASTIVRHTRATAAALPLEFEVSGRRTSKFTSYFLPAQVRLWNDFLYTVFENGKLDGFYRVQFRPRILLSFSVAQVLVGLRM